MAQAVKGQKVKRAPNRVQGIDAGIDDLVLRGGEGLAIEIGPGIEPIPTLTRTIGGASSVKVDVFDPERILLRNTLLAEKWEAELDGLGFRYAGLAKAENDLTLTLEDEWVALLKEATGQKSVKRADSTLAEFIKRLVEEAAPGLDFYCPQLHRKQPIGNKKEAKEAKDEARENRGKGIGDQNHLKIKGQSPTPAQKELAETALRIAESYSAPFVVMVALIAALIDETDMGAVASNNVLEGIGPGGAEIADAATEIKNFLTGSGGYGEGGALGFHKSHPEANYFEIAQGVQRSGAGLSSNGRANYGQFGTESREWVEAYEGGGGGGSLSIAEPFRFEVKKKESYWAAIKRLAKAVNWRAFIVLDRFYFMPEPELFRGEVRLAIDPDTPGIEDVDFEYNIHGEVTEVTVKAAVGQWKPPPGSVVTLEGYGPASLGFGDAPGGATEALSGNENATTHEGRDRYLVAKIEVPLSDEPAERIATIVLKTPTKPLPEKRAEGRSSKGTVGSHLVDVAGQPELGDTSVSEHPELKPGISEVVNAILKRFPALSITSTTGGTHAENSYHYLGRAADIGGSVEEMNKAAAWINESGLWEHLTEGIHNPGSGPGPSLLSVKDGAKVSTSYWGEPTWADHADHIHVAV